MFRKNLAPLFAFILIIFFFVQPEIVKEGALNGVILWYRKILPILFPMFVLSNILLQYNLIYIILNKISKISKKVFGSSLAIIPFIIGIIAGYPSGASVINSMIKNKRLSLAEANYLLSFTNLCSFQFISAVIILSMLNNYSLLVYIIIPHYIGAIILSFLLKKEFCEIKYRIDDTQLKTKSFNKVFSNSISTSLSSILTICGVIIIFSIISRYIMTILPMTNTSNISTIISSLIIGILEITNGCNIVSTSILPIEIKIIIINFLISFSGLSIIFQTITVITNFQVQLHRYIIVKFVHGLISSIISIIMIILFL